MACLALALQPSNGSNILLQTREWFPPARALVALSAFRQTRLSFASTSAAGSKSDDHDASSALGDDPLAASSGQVVVGVESRYLVVYRLVNSIYVLGVTTPDASNTFSCIDAVNQAVAVVVAACRGVDATPDKLHRKYPEVYMALDIVLRGVGAARLSAILSSMHSDNIAKLVSSAIDAEARVRGADPWAGAHETLSLERRAALQNFSSASFELPAETLAAGDEAAAASLPPAVPPSSDEASKPSEESPEDQQSKDPFAASEKINKPEEALVEGFKKTKETASLISDPSAALAGLEVSSLPPPAATKPTFIGVEGFEGEYGGIEFSNEATALSEAFQGFDNAFGGGLDASEFVNTTNKPNKGPGLGGLELLATSPSPGPTDATKGDGKTPLENMLASRTQEMTAPELFISEEINAEFRESLLARIGLKGTVFLRTLPPKQAAGKETEFSFRLENTSGMKKAVMQSKCASSLENGMFHIRTQSKEEPIPILKYSLQPKVTPLPLRLRLVKRHSGTLLSVMIQYASNPILPMPLTNVTFILKLPVDPTLLKVSPKAVLNRAGRELRWHVPDVPLKGPSGRLRARMPVDQDSEEGHELEVVGMVKFSAQSSFTLSGICLRPVSDGIAQFNEHWVSAASVKALILVCSFLYLVHAKEELVRK